MTSQCPVCGRMIADPEDCVGSDGTRTRNLTSAVALPIALPTPTPADSTTSGAYSKYPVIDCMVQALVK